MRVNEVCSWQNWTMTIVSFLCKSSASWWWATCSGYVTFFFRNCYFSVFAQKMFYGLWIIHCNWGNSIHCFGQHKENKELCHSCLISLFNSTIFFLLLLLALLLFLFPSFLSLSDVKLIWNWTNTDLKPQQLHGGTHGDTPPACCSPETAAPSGPGLQQRGPCARHRRNDLERNWAKTRLRLDHDLIKIGLKLDWNGTEVLLNWACVRLQEERVSLQKT